MSALTQVGAGVRLQLALVRRAPAQLLVLIAAPLFSAIFLSLAVNEGAESLVASAVIGPGLMSLWLISLAEAAAMLSEDRYGGRLEMFLSTSASLSLVVFGRILALSAAGMVAFAESWLVARFAFGLQVPVSHPGLVVIALLVTMLSSSFTATLLASAFVLSRILHVFQNSMTYPVYILGGVVVPLSAMPGWLQPASKAVYLSWCADLLREALTATAPRHAGLDIAMGLGLGVVALAVAIVLTRHILDMLRRNATAGLG
jgi:ABC-2 type transport system permease protein